MNKIFNVGDKATIRKVFGDKEVRQFAELSLDNNPLHLDEEYAKNTIFKGRIVHRMLVSSLFSAIIANKLPGQGSIYLNQTFMFKRPIFLNEEVKAEVIITNVRQDKLIITLDTTRYNSENEIAIEGEAIIKI